MDEITSTEQINRLAMLTKGKFIVNEQKVVSIYSIEGRVIRDYFAQGGRADTHRTEKEMEVVNKYARINRMKSACKTILEDVDLMLMGVEVTPEQGIANLAAFNDILTLLKAGHLKQAKARIIALGETVEGVEKAGLIGTSFESMPEKYEKIVTVVTEAFNEVNLMS